MESALKKEYTPAKTRSLTAKAGVPHIVTSDKFRANVQHISDIQRKRDLIFSLQETIVKLNQVSTNRYDFSYHVQHFFEELIFAETGIQSIRQGLRVFIDKLYADPVITKLIHFVFKEMQKSLNTGQIDQGIFEPLKLIGAIQEILAWYIERSSGIESILYDESPASNYDQIFNLNVFHDIKKHGFMGMEILSSIVLYGRAGQNLWFKVFVKENGEYILPHVEWNSWIDDTEIFTMKPLDEDVALSGIIPISPQTQRLMIDRLSVFIPYPALDLSPGKHEVEIEACLFNEKGDRLLSASSEEVLSVSRSHKQAKAVVSEQALGIWAKDYVSGDCISDLEVICVQQPSSNLLSDLIKINFDFEIYDRQGQSIYIEVRFYNGNGSLIKASSVSDKDQYMAIRSEVYVDEIVFKRFGIDLVIPRTQLHLDEDEKQFSCEVCILSLENKVLCGMLENFILPEIRLAPKDITVKPLSAPKVDSVSKNKAVKFSSMLSVFGRKSLKK